MKKIFGVLALGCLMVALAQAAPAQLAEKQEELARVKKYISQLDDKIVQARNAKQINRIAQLNDLKRKELVRREKLEKEIVQLQKKEGVPGAGRKVVPPGLAKKGGLQFAGGYGGGSALLKAGYSFPLGAQEFSLNAGLGIGNGFTIMAADAAYLFPFGNNFAGLEAGLAGYSKTVSKVPGLSGSIGGSNFGVGFFGGTAVGPLRLQVGFNSALGLTALGAYRF